jgi:hypothetical protein
VVNESLRWLPPKAFGLYVIELTHATMGAAANAQKRYLSGSSQRVKQQQPFLDVTLQGEHEGTVGGCK